MTDNPANDQGQSAPEAAPSRGRFSRPRGFNRGNGGGRAFRGSGNRGGGNGGGRGGGRGFSRNSRRDRKPNTPGIPSMAPREKKGPEIPPPPEGTVRIIPLGGVEEIGRNMTLVEYGDDIVVIDAGIQFQEDDTPGIDFILPNTQYLEERRHKIRGLVITHGHLDHIGGIPYILDRIGNPPVYTRRLTSLMVKKRQEEFAYLPKIDLREVETDTKILLGKLPVRFFGVTHTVPDSMGIIVDTPYGAVVCTGDIKLDHTDGVPSEEEQKEFSIFKNENVLMLMMDSTNIDKPGFSIPEHVVFNTLEQIITGINTRLIISAFASHLERLMHIVRVAERAHKKIVIEGRSMRSNIEIVRQLGLLKHRDDTIIQAEQMEDYPPEKIIILATGAQGDEFAALARIANKTHKSVRLTPDDTVVFSSSVIPGNERAVQKLMDNISRQGARILTYQTSDVHASGHGNRDEAAWIHKQIKPKFFMPQHGYHYKLRLHADLAVELGMNPKNIVIPDNSSIIEIVNGEEIIKRKTKAPAELRIVEGQSVGELSEVVMRDRKTLAQDGFCVVVATLDRRTGKLHKSADIISRGFVYLRENKDLMDQTRLLVHKTVQDEMRRPREVDIDALKSHLEETVSHFLLQKTHKRPIVIPVIVSV